MPRRWPRSWPAGSRSATANASRSSCPAATSRSTGSASCSRGRAAARCRRLTEPRPGADDPADGHRAVAPTGRAGGARTLADAAVRTAEPHRAPGPGPAVESTRRLLGASFDLLTRRRTRCAGRRSTSGSSSSARSARSRSPLAFEVVAHRTDRELDRLSARASGSGRAARDPRRARPVRRRGREPGDGRGDPRWRSRPASR